MARISFVELPVKGIAEAGRFFDEAFGWKMTEFGPTYACTMTGDVDLGLQADSGEATAAPLIVIVVDDVDQSLADVLAAGGKLSREVFSFPGGRRFHFLDPAGNELAVMEADKAT